MLISTAFIRIMIIRCETEEGRPVEPSFHLYGFSRAVLQGSEKISSESWIYCL